MESLLCKECERRRDEFNEGMEECCEQLKGHYLNAVGTDPCSPERMAYAVEHKHDFRRIMERVLALRGGNQGLAMHMTRHLMDEAKQRACAEHEASTGETMPLGAPRMPRLEV